jgi:cellulose synthase/poly-beta-1,6-N-acetylglucosamine synthase-like glycosyltransferase
VLPELIVGAAALAFGYHHFAYPMLLNVLANRARHSQLDQKPARAPDVFYPSVALIVPAHNEQSVIAAKITNIVALQYPSDKLRVVIACDGCSDDTVAIARRTLLALQPTIQVEIIDYRTNIGKVAVLNERIAAETSDIVALSDTSAILEPDALLRAVAHFADASVGVVCPTYRLLNAGSEGERAYWDYQTRIKADEALIGAPMGAHGAFYLLRRNVWQPLPADTINDDFILPMNIVAQGHRAVYDATIAAVELETTHPDQEFRRRIRIGAGNLQQVLRLPNLANPLHPGRAFVFLSGKGIRPMIPFLAIAAGVASAARAVEGDLVFAGLLVVGLTTSAVATFAITHRHLKLPRVAIWLGYLAEGYAASFIGACRYACGLEGKPWTKATVQASSAPTTITLTQEYITNVHART